MHEGAKHMAFTGKLLLVGCGKMGIAMLAGWRARGLPADHIQVVDPGAEQRAAAAAHGVAAHAAPDALPATFVPDIILLAVKPQGMDAVAPLYARFAGTSCFLSIAAGKTMATLDRLLGGRAAIVRSIPNTPAAVGRGITGAVANARVTPAQRTACDDLLQAIGQVVWVDEEGLIDTITAVSGSGPAYVFLLIETLAQAGIAAGLPPDLAGQLARVTVTGSGELAHQAAEDAATLRRNVTSPNGTTQAALDVLMAADGLAPLMVRAVSAAAQRSRELAT
jgi:pyrroline-5-carboxylate reductase